MPNFTSQLLLTNRIQDETLRRRESVLKTLFGVTFGILSLSTLALCLAFLSGFDRLILHRILAVLAALLTTLTLYWLFKRQRYFVAGYGLLAIYWLLATVMAMEWGVNLPAGLLIYSSVIVLSGIILGASYSLLALIGTIVVLFTVQYAIVSGHLHPDLSWRNMPVHLSDLVVYYFVFALLGVCSWLFNRQTDSAMQRMLRAEAALKREKATLEIKVADRTRELETAQMQKLQQLHRFTELGQFSTSLLHDLANHMATLSVDIEGMTEREYRSELQLRIKRRIAYIDTMVQWAYDHINGKVELREFDVRHEVQEILKVLRYNARTTHVELRNMEKPAAPLTLYGDPNRFRQLVANLVSNAIDAYPPVTKDDQTERLVAVEGKQLANGAIRLKVCDHGIGISKEAQAKIFEPFYSTRADGMGLGLYVVKQIAEEDFAGTIELASKPHDTVFTVTLHAVTQH